MEYLKFYLSLLTAIAAIAAALAAGRAAIELTPATLMAALALAYVLIATSTVVYLSVRKLRYALDHYRLVLQRLRVDYVPGGLSLNRDVWIDGRKKAIPRLFSVQDAAEVLIASSIVCLDLAAGTLLIAMLHLGVLAPGLATVGAFPLGAALGLQIRVWWVQRTLDAVDERLSVLVTPE